MTHLDKIKACFDEVGIEYHIVVEDECKCLYFGTEHDVLDHFIEFDEDEEVASY
jgi:hypothetical protein